MACRAFARSAGARQQQAADPALALLLPGSSMAVWPSRWPSMRARGRLQAPARPRARKKPANRAAAGRSAELWRQKEEQKRTVGAPTADAPRRGRQRDRHAGFFGWQARPTSMLDWGIQQAGSKDSDHEPSVPNKRPTTVSICRGRCAAACANGRWRSVIDRLARQHDVIVHQPARTDDYSSFALHPRPLAAPGSPAVMAVGPSELARRRRSTEPAREGHRPPPARSITAAAATRQGQRSCTTFTRATKTNHRPKRARRSVFNRPAARDRAAETRMIKGR